MRKTVFYYIVLIFLFASCEKVIHVDLNEANPQIVVDAQLSDTGDGMGHAVVRLSWTAGFYDTTITPVSQAKIKITDPRGHIYNFTEIRPGIYISTNSAAMQQGDIYELEIQAEGKTLTASSSLPQRVDIDSVNYGIFNFGPHGGEGNTISCFFTDPAGQKNYYQLNLYVNGTPQFGYFITRDDGVDGKSVEYIFHQNPLFDSSRVTVELNTLDEVAFEYYKVLWDNQPQGGMPAAPGNPPSNIKGDGIGLFRATNLDREEIIVPEFVP